jgi:hypothetical protein
LARLYHDHNVSQDLAHLLRADHDVVSARELSRERLTDDAQLLAAVLDERTVVTHDRRDFTLLHDAWLTWPAAFGQMLPPHRGILVLDAAPYRTLFSVLASFLVATPAPIMNELLWWHHRDGWRRRIIPDTWEPYSYAV